MKPRVLWIEDSARLELSNLLGPVYYTGEHDLTLAEDVTTAVNILLHSVFEVVIVDIRLPPGADPFWRRLYQDSGSDRVSAQLGLKLLDWALRSRWSDYPAAPPAWLTPKHVGVFTVESRREIEKNLDELRIDVYQQKVAGLPDTILLQLIAQLLAGRKASDR